jgi:hypothetical protein
MQAMRCMRVTQQRWQKSVITSSKSSTSRPTPANPSNLRLSAITPGIGWGRSTPHIQSSCSNGFVGNNRCKQQCIAAAAVPREFTAEEISVDVGVLVEGSLSIR